VGIGGSVGIPTGFSVGMEWVWVLKFNPHAVLQNGYTYSVCKHKMRGVNQASVQAGLVIIVHAFELVRSELHLGGSQRITPTPPAGPHNAVWRYVTASRTITTVGIASITRAVPKAAMVKHCT